MTWLLGTLGLAGGGIGIAALLGGGPWMLAFGGRVITAVITFLGRLNVWQLGCLALGLLLIVQHFQLLDARHDRDSWHKQFTSAKAALDKREAESKAQQKHVGKQITHYVTVTKPEIVERVRTIEAAPLPGGCKTPQAVLDADL